MYIYARNVLPIVNHSVGHVSTMANIIASKYVNNS